MGAAGSFTQDAPGPLRTASSRTPPPAPAGAGAAAKGGRIAALAAASELQSVSRVQYLLFVLLALFVQFNWGLYGVCSRYLQTSARQPIPTIQLSVVITAVATAGLVVFVALPAALRAALSAAAAAWRARRAMRQQQQGQPAPQQQPADGDAVAVVISAGKGAAALGLPSAAEDVDCKGQAASADAAAPTAAAAAEAKRAARRKLMVSAGIASFIGFLVALQSLTLIYASRFMYAFLVQLIFLLTPLVTAVANRCLLRQPTPRGLWLTLAAALAGSALVITGNFVGAGAGGAHAAAAPGVTRDMVVGLALALLSMLLLAAYLLALQVTQHRTSGAAVMWANMLVSLVVFTPLAFAVEGADWSWTRQLSPLDWAIMFYGGFFIGALNTMWTQSCSRVLGAAVISLFICMRLVSSVVGSAVLMHEIPSSPMVWAGMGVCIVSMTLFMGVQARDKKRAAQQVEAAAAAAAAEPRV